MKRVIKFNVIYIIQSLSRDDRQTGDEIAQQIKYACFKRGIEPMDKLINVSDRVAFFERLQYISDSIKHGAHPYIHFEMHGSANDGLSLKNGEFISWGELKVPIRKINIASKNNLYVSLATCHGANFLELYEGEFDKPCPFYGYIGATKEIDAFDFEASFTSFFHALLTEDSITCAIKALHDSVPEHSADYIFIDCESYRIELMKLWENENGSIGSKNKRVKHLFQRAKTEYSHIRMSNKQLKQDMERFVFGRYTDDYLAQCKSIFLHEIEIVT